MPLRHLPAVPARPGFLASSLVGLGATAFGEKAPVPRLATSIRSGAASRSDLAADALDLVLESVQAAQPTSDVHRWNRVPMEAETLAALKRADALAPWIEDHPGAVGPDAKPRGCVGAERWR